MAIIRGLIKSQQYLSSRFDQILPSIFNVAAVKDFEGNFCSPYLKRNSVVFDIGGGSHPFFSIQEKQVFSLTVVGIDICMSELESAPTGSYDKIICSDVTKFRGGSEADLVVCCALLEHVIDVEKALQCIASCLREGGIALIYVPSRTAIFAKLNLVLPENFKKALLSVIFPHKERQGFRSYYDRCTPKEIKEIATSFDLNAVGEAYYFRSTYFMFCFPLHVVWRIWLLALKWVRGNNAAESFAYALQKKSHTNSKEK